MKYVIKHLKCTNKIEYAFGAHANVACKTVGLQNCSNRRFFSLMILSADDKIEVRAHWRKRKYKKSKMRRNF